MTDTTSFIPNSSAIASSLNYAMKPSAVRSKSYRASILPTNKATFNPTDTCIIYIPGGRRGTYLDAGQSYVRMTIKNTGNQIAYLDNQGSCVIQRLDVFHGSNLLETIQDYGVLSNYIFDMQASQSQRAGLSSLMGFNFSGDRKGASLAAGASLTVCVPIFSGSIGTQLDVNLPIGMLADDIRLEFTFETAQKALVLAAAGNSGFEVTDFQLELCIVELSDEGESMVRQAIPPNGPVFLHGSSWRHYTSTLASGTQGGYSTLVPARFASLKQIACLPRSNLTMNSAVSYSLSSRINPNIDYYWWRVGSSIIPSKAVYLENNANTRGFAEGYAELLKGWHALNTVANTSVIGPNYNVSDLSANIGLPVTARTDTANAGANSYQCAFAIAQELESFAQRSDVMLSGMNTLSAQIFFEANIGTQVGAGLSDAYTLDFYAWYDHILVLENGILSVKI